MWGQNFPALWNTRHKSKGMKGRLLKASLKMTRKVLEKNNCFSKKQPFWLLLIYFHINSGIKFECSQREWSSSFHEWNGARFEIDWEGWHLGRIWRTIWFKKVTKDLWSMLAAHLIWKIVWSSNLVCISFIPVISGAKLRGGVMGVYTTVMQRLPLY